MPKDTDVLRLATYGTLVIGEVPKSERVMILIPNAIIRSEIQKTKYLRINSFLIIYNNVVYL